MSDEIRAEKVVEKGLITGTHHQRNNHTILHNTKRNM